MASKRQEILDAIVTLFGTIQIVNGYNFDIAYVSRGLKNIASHNDFPALFVAGADEERENLTSGFFFSEMTVFIYGYVKRVNDLNGLQIELDKLIADATKAIWSDPGLSCKALTSEITKINSDQSDDANEAGFVMEVVYKYKAQGSTP